MIPLSLATLADVPADVARPAYNRSDLRAGILHIGVGNFHRAHMAVYLDRLMNMGDAHDWAIIGAGLRAGDGDMRERLAAQDWLTTVVDRDGAGDSARITGAMVDYCPVDPAAILAAMADPLIRIVSLTVTEGGYFLGRGGAVRLDDPALQADIANPDTPKTVFGMFIAALRARKDQGDMPFTVLSCDNLQGNGDITRRVTLAVAEAQDPELAGWIAAHVAFPNGMVDCITPRSGPRELALVQERFGIRDAAPVVCEPFRQWVIEDHFPAGRPPLEKVGVTFVDDVKTYEIMKLRLLNASHASLCYAAALMGYSNVDQAMADPVLLGWLKELPTRETIPTLELIEGVDYAAYLDTVLKRFGNPAIADTIARLAQDGSDRQPQFILPTVRDALAREMPIDGFALELAIWMQFCANPPIPLEDPLAASLQSGAEQGPEAFLNQREIFGILGRDPRLRAAVARAWDGLSGMGVRGMLVRYIAT